MIYSNLYLLKCDTPRPWGLYFQDSASPQMEAIIELHNYVMYYLIIILFACLSITSSILYTYVGNKFSHVYLVHGTLIELIWTISPALVLTLIAFPSFKLLYITDDVTEADLTVKVEAHQWYWSYEFAEFTNSDDEFIGFDSYMINESELEDGRLRMLEVDNRIILPTLSHTRFNISSTDVIHSLACPSLGLKCDAYPYKTSQISVFGNREGTYYGQCSEICGILHSSMPIVIQAVSLEKYLIYLKNQ
jgi:heme/copper-type cytochrome/quinol oxidase subunit 2